MSEALWTELEKIDVLCDRLNLTYEEANQALKRAHGDVIQALADCEKEMELENGKVGKLWNGTKHQFNRMWQSQVKIKHNQRTVFSVSAPLGIAIGYMIWRRPALRVLGLMGVAAAAMQNYEMELESMTEVKDFEPHFQATHPMTYAEGELGLQ
ncbi:hypothetical protein Desdi_2986 [Desulfitobacterium dichloroeliminans LMG P-21439]|uniref:Uncharacterized protein n=1 Tax=Desulfitobacterium dichloroeliminans (strain LMG P-21439 / DCA1) TaxID=871963 RepID=L0FCK7_DESDL|nr:DUF4342 domain-containing protein [Desulfitobacterium dichloroeliminans]AGA70391.1 hypothetical protein Desdi_2986 [Desulfitobacterium dichloroeliminans LMG P-21439]